MDFSEKYGKDIEDATKLALKDLDLKIDEVDVIVLEEPSKGFLGIGSKLAKVRVEKKKFDSNRNNAASKVSFEPKINVEAKVKVEEAKPLIQERKQEAKFEPQRTNRAEAYTPRRENIRPESKPEFKSKPYDKTKREERKPIVLAELEEVTGSDAEKFLKEMTTNMGIDLEIKVYTGEDIVYVNIEGKDSGTIIGKRGQTLDSVQYLTGLVVNKGKEKHVRVIVNAENYREKREKTLELLANRLSDKVVKSGKSVRLEPMNPYERKVIHATLQNHNHVTTRSEGEEPYRRVIIEQK
ncbi:MAG: RNA-binding cell elongation regulator Jag/EloR [Eubacteriales bacterium]